MYALCACVILLLYCVFKPLIMRCFFFLILVICIGVVTSDHHWTGYPFDWFPFSHSILVHILYYYIIHVSVCVWERVCPWLHTSLITAVVIRLIEVCVLVNEIRCITAVVVAVLRLLTHLFRSVSKWRWDFKWNPTGLQY